MTSAGTIANYLYYRDIVPLHLSIQCIHPLNKKRHLPHYTLPITLSLQQREKRPLSLPIASEAGILTLRRTCRFNRQLRLSSIACRFSSQFASIFSLFIQRQGLRCERSECTLPRALRFSGGIVVRTQ